jgi:hypothetical protein
MSIESKVFEKLFTSDKVELESQKVELSLITDATEFGNALATLNNNILKNGEKANDLLSIVQKDGQMALAIFREGTKLQERIARMYEDLGIPSDGSEEPGVKNLLKQMNDLLTYRKRYSF